ncbi:hypothetical protein ACFLRM_06170 [Acidobacteriota bacterium]
MIVYRISNFLKRKLPAPIFSLIRRVGTAILTPIAFSYQSGHFLSSLRAKAVDRTGQPRIWYTFPLIELLETKKFKTRSILEFGGGQSTLWWAKRAKEVVSFENSSKWFNYLRKRVPPNVTIYLAKDEGPESANKYLHKRTFDVITIDSFHRFKCAIWSTTRLAKGGAIILDDSEGHWTESFPILDLI